MGDVTHIWAAHRAQLMSAGELTYFHGAHFQHIVDWEEHRRLTRLRQQAERSMRDRWGRRRNGRAA